MIIQLQTNFGEITHRFSDLDSGTYFVELYVESNKGCSSTEVQKIVIDKNFIFYIPNKFTPNRDLINDVYMLMWMEYLNMIFIFTVDMVKKYSIHKIQKMGGMEISKMAININIRKYILYIL